MYPSAELSTICDDLWRWRYSSTHYLTRYYTEGSGQLHAMAALPPPGKIPLYVLVRRLGAFQSRSGRRGEESNPGRPARSTVTVLTELTRLIYGTVLRNLVIASEHL
jgi:hypothetical protein